eukprot:GHVT01001849.1.p1 GENE.GHVT01001849.1~~GHVT01001849.1.p1  ORF type:complete len:102 (+),score=8.74 GHVT01001849.1:147-452(+)
MRPMAANANEEFSAVQGCPSPNPSTAATGCARQEQSIRRGRCSFPDVYTRVCRFVGGTRAGGLLLDAFALPRKVSPVLGGATMDTVDTFRLGPLLTLSNKD